MNYLIDQFPFFGLNGSRFIEHEIMRLFHRNRTINALQQIGGDATLLESLYARPGHLERLGEEAMYLSNVTILVQTDPEPEVTTVTAEADPNPSPDHPVETPPTIMQPAEVPPSQSHVGYITELL